MVCGFLGAMALAFQDVLNDAKKLTSRLNEHDSTADALVSQMQAVYQQVEAMKQVSFFTLRMPFKLYIFRCFVWTNWKVNYGQSNSIMKTYLNWTTWRPSDPVWPWWQGSNKRANTLRTFSRKIENFESPWKNNKMPWIWLCPSTVNMSPNW